MKIAFKKNGNSFVGKVIQAWTFSKYCHVEMIFSNGQWFSSRDNGPEFSDSIPAGNRIEDYDFVDLPISQEDEERIYRWCENELFVDDEHKVKSKYDWTGVVLSFLPIPVGWQSAKNWFCSEIYIAALQLAGWFSGYTPARISPRKAYSLTIEEIKKRSFKTAMFYSAKGA